MGKAREKPPTPIARFFEQNSELLLISGVFAALLMYLSQLTISPNRPIIVGMIGSALMFGIAFVSVLHQALIDFSRAAESNSIPYMIIYLNIILSLIFITISVGLFFSQYSTTVFDVIESMAAIILLSIIVVVGWNRTITIPTPINLGPVTGYLVQKSWTIVSLSLVIILIASQLSVIDLDQVVLGSYFEYVDNTNSTLLMLISVFFLLLFSMITLVVSVIVIRLIVLTVIRFTGKFTG